MEWIRASGDNIMAEAIDTNTPTVGVDNRHRMAIATDAFLQASPAHKEEGHDQFRRSLRLRRAVIVGCSID